MIDQKLASLPFTYCMQPLLTLNGKKEMDE